MRPVTGPFGWRCQLCLASGVLSFAQSFTARKNGACEIWSLLVPEATFGERPKCLFSFEESFIDAPVPVQKAFYKQATLLEKNLTHPSLKARKTMSQDIWRARVSLDWRFYFRIQGNVYYLIDITKHPK